MDLAGAPSGFSHYIYWKKKELAKVRSKFFATTYYYIQLKCVFYLFNLQLSPIGFTYSFKKVC